MAPKLGKVKRVLCTNFVTYSNFEFHATDYLNIILGPNGTGKSTVISAIFLGLGGEPKFLGRSSSLGDFVRNGSDESSITIELYEDESGSRFSSFRRDFDREDHCQFYINNQKLSKRAFKEKVATLNVQINNLCQVLPQDRLHEFASMNAHELFTNTLIAVRGAGAEEEIQNLKDMRKQHLDKQKELHDKTERHKQLKSKIESLQEGVTRYNQVQEFVKQVDVCNIKLEWLNIQSFAEKIEKMKVDLKHSKDNEAAKKEQYEKLQEEHKLTEKTTKQLEVEITKKRNTLKKSEADMIELQNKYDSLHENIKAEKHNFQLRKRRLEERGREIKKSEELARLHEDDYKRAKAKFDADDNSRNEDKIERDLRAFQSEISHQNQARSKLGMTLETEVTPSINKIKATLEKLNSTKDQKMNYLRRYAPDVVTALTWLRNNRDRFEKHVYEPVLLELTVSDPDDLIYVENTISMRDMLAFTCESKADMAILTSELCVKQKLSINAVFSPTANQCTYRPRIAIENLRHFGFKDYLLNLIEAPPVILNSLCGLYQIHNIPVSNQDLSCDTDNLNGIGLYFAGNYRFSVTISQYTQKKSEIQVHIKPLNIIGAADTLKQIKPLEHSLATLKRKADAIRNECSTIEAKIEKLNFEYEALREKRAAIKVQKENIQHFKTMAERKREVVRQLRREVEEENQDEGVVKDKIHRFCKEMQNIVMEQIHTAKMYQAAAAEAELHNLLLEKHKHITRNQTEYLEDAHKRWKDAHQLLSTVSETVAQNRDAMKARKRKLLEKTKGVEPTSENYENHAIFTNLSNDTEAIELQINELSARMELMQGEDNGLIESYERETKKLAGTERQLEELNNDIASMTMQINMKFLPWLKEVNQIIETIHQTFKNYTEKMGFKGAVQLERQEDHDFDSYGMRILVSFRANGELQALDRTVQSGGERSLCIAVYTLSLQQLTHCPFRCVDEINQGMDSTNERKVFDLLLQETTRDESSQYFFVTPKLLPNLPYNERMTVHIIFNGSFMDEYPISIY